MRSPPAAQTEDHDRAKHMLAQAEETAAGVGTEGISGKNSQGAAPPSPQPAGSRPKDSALQVSRASERPSPGRALTLSLGRGASVSGLFSALSRSEKNGRDSLP